MANTTRKFSTYVIYGYTKDSTGQVYIGAASSRVWTRTLTEGKVSVDSGAFQPGVYRVNPYEVYHEEIEVDDADQEITWIRTAGYTHWLKTSGKIAAMFMATQLSKDLYQSVADDLMQQAHQKARAKIAQSDLSLGEDLGELRETLAMLKDPLSSLRKFLLADSGRNLKTIKLLLKFRVTGSFAGRSGKAAAKAAADTWLELRYGFRPLIMLLGDLMEQANKQANSTFRPDIIRSARAKVVMGEMVSFNMSPTQYCYIDYPGTQFRTWWYTKDVVNMTGYASVQYRQSSPMSTLQNLGLTPAFWPEIAWELTRLSFVWDWFITVGPWIQSFRFKPTIEILGATTGIKRDIVRHYAGSKVRVLNNSSGIIDKPITATGRRYVKAYRRYTNPELPLTPLLRLDSVLDLNKLVDSLSLIFQRIFR